MNVININDIGVVDKTTVYDNSRGHHRSRSFGFKEGVITNSRFDFRNGRRFSAIVFQEVCVGCPIAPKNLLSQNEAALVQFKGPDALCTGPVNCFIEGAYSVKAEFPDGQVSQAKCESLS